MSIGINEYLKSLPADRRSAITANRKVILDNLPEGYEECMSYGMIGYVVPHRIHPKGYHCDPSLPLPFANLASQKNHMALFPGMDMSKSMSKGQEAAWTAKFKAGPSGLLLLQPKGGDPMEARQLLLEFFSAALCAIIAATTLATTVGSVTCRAIMVAMMGLFGWLALSVSQWTWYHYPFSFIALDLIDQTAGWLLAGFVIAKLVKPIQPLPGN